MKNSEWDSDDEAEDWKADATGKSGHYRECPACHHQTAFVNSYDGLLSCALCGQTFHEDFKGFVRRIRVVPEPPRDRP